MHWPSPSSLTPADLLRDERGREGGAVSINGPTTQSPSLEAMVIHTRPTREELDIRIRCQYGQQQGKFRMALIYYTLLHFFFPIHQMPIEKFYYFFFKRQYLQFLRRDRLVEWQQTKSLARKFKKKKETTQNHCWRRKDGLNNLFNFTR